VETSGGFDTVAVARHLMDAFAERTGLTSDRPDTRYLWTDAFAVCNWLTLFRRTGSEEYRDLAVLLVERVHHVLGRYRDDDTRSGWISGLGEAEGELHPTAGGLRIGKRLKERGPDDPYDAALEWDRDGQYYHYLVRWMHALGRMGVVLGDARYHAWAVELAEAAHGAFAYAPGGGGRKRMVWKMSTDLSRPLVPSEGAHDPLDGLVTACALRAGLPPDLLPRPELESQIEELAEMCSGRRWATDDPLGVGGLLMDARWMAALRRTDWPRAALLSRSLLPRVWGDALVSLEALARGYSFGAPPEARLAFRELGLAIGLHGVESPTDIARFAPLADVVVSAWMAPAARAGESWRAHEDINAVMLATALVPDEYLEL
jgi:hypothetical protein